MSVHLLCWQDLRIPDTTRPISVTCRAGVQHTAWSQRGAVLRMTGHATPCAGGRGGALPPVPADVRGAGHAGQAAPGQGQARSGGGAGGGRQQVKECLDHIYLVAPAYKKEADASSGASSRPPRYIRATKAQNATPTGASRRWLGWTTASSSCARWPASRSRPLGWRPHKLARDTRSSSDPLHASLLVVEARVLWSLEFPGRASCCAGLEGTSVEFGISWTGCPVVLVWMALLRWQACDNI